MKRPRSPIKDLLFQAGTGTNDTPSRARTIGGTVSHGTSEVSEDECSSHVSAVGRSWRERSVRASSALLRIDQNKRHLKGLLWDSRGSG